MVTLGPRRAQPQGEHVAKVSNPAKIRAWCRCGKFVNQRACDDEDSSIFQREASTSSVSTLSIRESRTDGTDITDQKPSKCQTCLKAEARKHHHMLAGDNTDLDFRPPDEILVDRRGLPPRLQKHAILTRQESRQDAIDMTHIRDSQKTPVLYSNSISTPETSINFQRDAHIPVSDNATPNRFFPIPDPNGFVPSPEVDNFDRRLVELRTGYDTEPSDAMRLVAAMDINQAPSDERLGVGSLEVASGSLCENPSRQQTVPENIQSPQEIVYDLSPSPSDEDGLTSKGLHCMRIHVGRRMMDEIDNYANFTSPDNPRSTPPRLDDEERAFDILRDEELNKNFDNSAATAEYIAYDPHLQKAARATDSLHELPTEHTAMKVDASTSAEVQVSLVPMKVGLVGENQVIDQGGHSLNPFSWLCAL